MKTKKEIIEYTNTLKGFEGYVQFSHRLIDKNCNIFVSTDSKVKDESGFIYEADFCNVKESISIKQINNSFLIDKTDISNIPQSDEFCEGMSVKKLKKVAFAGFEGDK
jgi:hypothetical protein